VIIAEQFDQLDQLALAVIIADTVGRIFGKSGTNVGEQNLQSRRC